MKTTTGVCISRAHGALECVSLTVLTGAFVVDEIDENVGGVTCREKSGAGHHKQRQLLHCRKRSGHHAAHYRANVSHSAQHSTLAALALTCVALTVLRRLIGNFAQKAAHGCIIGSAVRHAGRRFADLAVPQKQSLLQLPSYRQRVLQHGRRGRRTQSDLDMQSCAE